VNRYIARLWSGDGTRCEFTVYAGSMNEAIDKAQRLFPGKAMTVMQTEI
jgi:hypothetical protein